MADPAITAAQAARHGPAARVLPEKIWQAVESEIPALSINKAVRRMNALVIAEDPDAAPVTRCWYRRHAALRQAQRLALAAAQPAAQHPTPAEHDTLASSAASIDPELGADDRTTHAADHPAASDGPSSPAHTPTDTPAQQDGQQDTLDDTFGPGAFSIDSEDSEPDAPGAFDRDDSVHSAEWVHSVLASRPHHVPGKYSRCAAVARRAPRAFCAAQASNHTLLLRRRARQVRLRKSWAAS